MSIRILTGDCRELLRKQKAKSVHCCVCSPPYWGLRDYNIPPSIWGGDPKCEHEFGALERGKRKDMLPADETSSKSRSGSTERQNGASHNGGRFCQKCDAWLGCLGLEPTYQLYVEHMVEIFRGVWRVLRDDGTLWVNLGDCYATRPCGWSAQKYWDEDRDDRTFRDKPFATAGAGGLKPKDLAGIPWRVAFALQDDGWVLRRDIVWQKLNPMPESVYDRPTTSHEYLFLLAKSNKTLVWRHEDGRWAYKKPEPEWRWRHRDTRAVVAIEPAEAKAKGWFRFNLWSGFDYYYDFAAIMEPSSPNSHARAARSRSNDHKNADGGPLADTRGPQSIAIGSPVAGRMMPVGIGHNSRPTKGVPNGAHRGRGRPDGEGMERWNAPGPNSRVKVDRVPRSRKLAEYGNGKGTVPKANEAFDLAMRELVPMRNKRSVWSIATQPFKEAHFATFPEKLVEPCILAGCPKGGVVLDLFGGSGTVGVVAKKLGRGALLIEINKEYAAMAKRRIERVTMGPEQKKRADIKASGKLKPVRGLPLFSTRKPVVRSATKGASA